MDKQIPDVSVVTVSYNTRDLLAQCLASVFEETPNLILEVIVVDNASVDGSCEMVKEKFPDVKLIINEDNKGISKANNQGIRASTGRTILLLNPDTIVRERSIERMVAFLDDNPGIGACTCRLSYPDGTYQRNAFPLPSIWGAVRQYSAMFDRFPALMGRIAPEWIDYPDRTRPVGYCSGSYLLFTRTCMDDVGYMDEEFFLYGDDLDLCKKTWEADWPVYYVAEGNVVHYEGSSTERSINRRLGELRGTLQYLRKWRGVGYARLYEIVVALCSLYRYSKRCWLQRHTSNEDRWLSDEITFYRKLITGRYQR